jgi:LPPG:FO 2-phospho-L-lactate transferase
VVVLLAGGTGGAKLAAGMYDLLGPGELTVIANTGDDVEMHGVHVSPDPDLVTYWLAGTIDERGWGIRGDTWAVMDALEAAGRPAWFRLGDRDLAMCLIRTELMHAGARQTEAHRAVVEACGVEATVLPMSDDPVRTEVRSRGEWLEFQRFMIVERAAAPIEAVELRGAESATPTPEVLAAIAAADAIVVGPSNPIISIGPILAVPGMRAALTAAKAPVVAVSPFVDGRAVKGPTDAFMEHAGHARSAAGIAGLYAGTIDGIVCDERAEGLPVPALSTDTLMDSEAARRRVAHEVLGFVSSLGASAAAPDC